MPDSDRLLSMMTANTVHAVPILRVAAAGAASCVDPVATEEPMEVVVNGEPFAVIMRTPGADLELAAGFLLAERIVDGPADLRDIRRHAASRNRIEVSVGDAAIVRLAATIGERRRVTTNSACGLCGRVSIESLQVDAPPIAANWTIPASLVPTLPTALRRAQAVFSETGGLHAAGLFDADGRLDMVAEDVGRHNAVDKVIGRMLIDGRLPLDRSILVVSGRASFELVQKAFLAGIAILVAVSAPSSLAVELASDVGITLLGFVRSETFNVYSSRWRVTGLTT